MYVNYIFKHPNFNYHTLDHDIALIKLKSPLQFDQYIQPACIPEELDIPMEDMYVEVGRGALSLGWSLYYNQSNWTTILMTDYKINIFPRENCSRLMLNISDTHEIICAGLFSNY